MGTLRSAINTSSMFLDQLIEKIEPVLTQVAINEPLQKTVENSGTLSPIGAEINNSIERINYLTKRIEIVMGIIAC
jgi:hypothetical protein